MRAYCVVLAAVVSAGCVTACGNRRQPHQSPLGKVTGYRLVRFASACSGTLQFRHVCGRNPWSPSCGDRFQSVRRGEPFGDVPRSSSTGTHQIGCEDGWAVWADDSSRVVAFCALENRVVGIGDLDESSDKKLKRIAAQLFGTAATNELSDFHGRSHALPPITRLEGGSATEAAMPAEPGAWLTHHGVWSGVAWQGWTDVFTWDDRATGDEHDELRLWSPVVSTHRPKLAIDDEYLEGVRCIEFAIPTD